MTPNLDLGELMAFRQGLAIAHQVPGRIRLRIDPELADWALRQKLGIDEAAAWLAALPGILGVRANPIAASVVVEYDARRIAPDWWETLILGADNEALELLLGILAKD
jgi:hypothetical protein